MSSHKPEAAVKRRVVDFLVSHAGQDQAWAEWLAWQLTDAGFIVELDVWDWAPGQDFLARMQEALDRAERLLAVWSDAYFRSPFGAIEFRAAFLRQAHDAGRVVPVLVEPVIVPELYASMIYVDLVGLDETAAAERLRAQIVRQRPITAPRFPPPSKDKPAFAGSPPTSWKVPLRNPHFTGRGELLAELRRRLRAEKYPLVVQALHGLGGVGKTQLAIEYAYRFAVDYKLVWWLDAEEPALLGSQLAALAGELGLPTGRPGAEAVSLVLAELRRRSNWLLIFDNASRPQDVFDYLPGGSGQVLITSRHPGWGAVGGRLEVDVLDRSETVALLRRRLPELDEELAHQLAAELGDLPLAAAQAAGYLEVTGLSPAAYLDRFRRRRASLLAQGEVLGYQGRLNTTWTLSVDQLGIDSPAAVQLLQLASLFAAEPIPLRLFTDHPELLAEPLRTAAADPDDLDDLVGLLIGFSLVRRHQQAIQMHRLVQAAIRHQLPPDQQQREQERVLAVLAAARPGEPSNPASWPFYAELAPHVLATSPLGDDRADSRRVILDTAGYVLAEGDFQASRRVTAPLVDRWRRALGYDHPDTLQAATTLITALTWLVELEAAGVLGKDTVERSRRVLGPDHPITLQAAAALIVVETGLLELRRARTLGEDTVERSRRVLGPDHPGTLQAEVALTVALTGLGELEPARTLGEDTVERSRRVLGPDHPTTLRSAAHLTFALTGLGEAERAVTLGEDTVNRGRGRFGPDHPTIIYAAANLALALVRLGEAESARSARTLGEDTVESSRQAFGPDHPLTLWAQIPLTFALAALSGLAEAGSSAGDDMVRVAAEATMKSSEHTFGPDHPMTRLATAAATFANRLTTGPFRQVPRKVPKGPTAGKKPPGLGAPGPIPGQDTVRLAAETLATALDELRQPH